MIHGVVRAGDGEQVAEHVSRLPRIDERVDPQVRRRVVGRQRSLVPLADPLRPSACEPDENLCDDAPEASPAQNMPGTVDMWS